MKVSLRNNYTKTKTKSKTKIKKHIEKIIKNDNLIEYYLNPIISDKEIKELEGHFFPLESFPIVSKNQNIDVYRFDNNGQKHLLLKFRIKLIPKNLTETTFQALEKEAMTVHYNRGAPAGILRRSQLPPYVGELVKPKKFRTFYYGAYDLKYHQDSIGNKAQSSIIGYYDQVDRNIYRRQSVKDRIKQGIKPLRCRMTQFTKKEPEKWNQVIPLINKIDDLFKNLIPDKYQLQKKRAEMTPNYVINNTAFSTITINYNWRTALHRDAGDFQNGFGNLIVLEKGEVKGGYLGFPQYGICIQIKDGDFLAMDVHQWHCNTELENPNNSVRLSMVSYLREGMIKCI
jgi:hypothetical protein